MTFPLPHWHLHLKPLIDQLMVAC